jgi:ribosomal protein L31E
VTEYTIHLHKHVHGRSFKKRSPWAIKSVVEFANKTMGTKDVRIDPKLNEVSLVAIAFLFVLLGGRLCRRMA